MKARFYLSLILGVWFGGTSHAQTTEAAALSTALPPHVWNLHVKKDRQKLAQWIAVASNLSNSGLTQYSLGTGAEFFHHIELLFYAGYNTISSDYGGGPSARVDLNIFPVNEQKEFFFSGKFYRIFGVRKNHGTPNNYDFAIFTMGMDLSKTSKKNMTLEVGVQMPTSDPSIHALKIDEGVPFLSIGFKVPHKKFRVFSSKTKFKD